MPDVFVAPNATVIGRTSIAIRSSVWYGAVVRADLNTVTIGRGTAVQDRAVISTVKSVEGHVEAATVIGNDVVIGASIAQRAIARAISLTPDSRPTALRPPLSPHSHQALARSSSRARSRTARALARAPSF